MLNVDVTTTKWFLDPCTARIYPVFGSVVPIRIEDKEVNSFPMREATYSQLKKFSKRKRIEVNGLHFSCADEKFSVPKHCPDCHNKVSNENGMLVCPAKLCNGKPLVSLYGLLSICRSEDIDLQDIESYLTIFPVNKEDYTNVLNVVEKQHGLFTYLTLFKQASKKDIGPRYDLLQQTFGEHLGQSLWLVECELEKKLLAGLSHDIFWWILNLPGITDVVAAENLSKLDPNKLLDALNNDQEVAATMIEKCGAPIEARGSIIFQKAYWSRVLAMLNSMILKM